MKLTKKQKKEIARLLANSFRDYTKYDIKNTYSKLLIIIEKHKDRSLPEHRLYWGFCAWLACNMPDRILNVFDIGLMNSDIIHNLFKVKFEINSVAFSNMEENEFNDYFQKCISWTASYILKCNINDLREFLSKGEV